MRDRQGTVLLFLIGLITVMLVTAIAFVRNMQMATSSMQGQRRDELARLAADMGMQHALAVCMHEYAMPKEVHDGTVVTGSTVATRYDGPTKNVFNILAPPQLVNTSYPPEMWRQPTTTYDMSASIPFHNLFSTWTGSRYSSGFSVVGFGTGFTSRLGYARWFEANRWNYAPDVTYDPASYDNLDFNPVRAPTYLKAPPLPVAGGVSTPFPVVDPYEAGKANVRPSSDAQYNPLDNPLFLDSEYRPVGDASKARYRLRYAISTQDMSSALWANTDMPWLDDANNWTAGAAAKRQYRRGYGEVIEAVGRQIIPADNYQDSLQSIFLGYGPLTNNQFFQNGVPYDWATRNPNGFVGPDQPCQPMAYRSDQNNQRRFHSVLGSPFMNAFDPNRADGTKRWLGSAIPSFTDLGFALSPITVNWEYDGSSANSAARSDLLAQFATTPFGKPYDSTGHPWAINILTASNRVLGAMVSAYMPPESRRMRVTTETQDPHYHFVDTFASPAITHDGWGTKTINESNPGLMSYAWVSNSWAVPLEANLSIPGPGIDLFTNTFQPGGVKPFDYATPPNRNYFSSSQADRPFPTNGVQDTRGTNARYPGLACFAIPSSEPKSHKMTQWLSVTANPVQVQDDIAPDYPLPEGAIDNLARHIVFYVANPKPATHPNHNYITTHVQMMIDGSGYLGDFTPANPIMRSTISLYQSKTADQSYVVYWGDGNPTPPSLTRLKTITTPAATTNYRPIHIPEDFSINPKDRLMEPEQVTTTTKPETWRITRSTSGSATTAGNSYWNRLGLAFLHAVVVTQTANLAWADPQDARTQLPACDVAISSGATGSNASPGNTTTYSSLPAPLNAAFARQRYSPANGRSAAPTYNTNPTDLTNAGLSRKGPGNWDPKASDFDSLEKVDRQFLANLGESFDNAGVKTPLEVLTNERPPRYLRNQCRGSGSYPGATTFHVGMNMNVAEYRVSNNIRTLLTPVDTSTGGALTTRSTDDQSAVNTPRKLWLLDEWNAGTALGYAAEVGYTPGTALGPHPTRLARARAKLMERMLNDWRMSFLGAAKSYSATFRPKDFDGDGQVFCSGYLSGSSTDPDTGLTCFAPVAGGGHDGPGAPTLTVFSVTGCLTFTRSHQYKIHVRGELVDNALNKAVSEHYLEAAVLLDPDNNIVRGDGVSAWAPPPGLDDSTVMMQHTLHNFYRGDLTRSYP